MNLTVTIILFILSIALLIAISFCLPGKLKVLKGLLWVINILMALFLFVIVPIIKNDDIEGSKHLIGLYRFDVANSKFSNINLDKFAQLTLNIKEDHTFTFNMSTPFFSKKNGQWVYHIDGDAEFINCKLDGAELAHELTEIGADLIFENNMLKNGNTGDRIAFKHNTSILQIKK